MSMVEGEPLPGTQNVDGSEKPTFATFDKDKGENLVSTGDEDESGKSKGKSKS